MTYGNDYGVDSRVGFGLAMYRTMLPQKKVNILFGFEYNRTTRFVDYFYKSHNSASYDVTYTVNSISIPFSVRINVGKRVKLFAEPGIFLDLNIGARGKGTSYSILYQPDENGNIQYTKTQYDEKADVSNINYGFALGVGIKIPVSKHYLIIKPDYKIGLVPVYDYYDQLSNNYFRMTVAYKL